MMVGPHTPRGILNIKSTTTERFLKDRLLCFEAILANCSEEHRIMKSYDKDWKCTWDFSAESEGVHMDV